ncbi:MAG: YqgE/AlgH family protein [Sphingomonadales bacterium]|nr:YqgE/AlgH family protein [Sphingomonadales bacterium]
MTQGAYLGGRLLLAMPGMPDPRFAHAVVAMCLHDAKGALGIGVGQLIPGIGLHRLLEDLEVAPDNAPDVPVHFGGPVEPQRGFVLHSDDWSGPGTIAAGAFGALSTSLDVLRAIAGGSGPSRWLVALGYAGWGAGQLEGEMTRHGWYAAEGRAEVLFDHPAEQRWSAAWRAEGIDPALLAAATGSA